MCRPVLSTFSPQHLSPGSYGPGAPHYTASLRRGSNSRLLPVSSPVTPSSSLPTAPPLHHHHHCSPYQSASGSPCSSEAHSRGSPPARRHSPDGRDGADEGRGCGLQRHRHPNSDLPSVHSGEGQAAAAAATVHSSRASECSDGDGRSELDLRTDAPEVQFSGRSPPTRPMEVR